MSQNSSVNSSPSSTGNYNLNSVLQAALSSLDVQLEEELARYRRRRVGRPVMTNRSLGRNRARKPLELISVGEVQQKSSPSQTNKTIPQLKQPSTIPLPNLTAKGTTSLKQPQEPLVEQTESLDSLLSQSPKPTQPPVASQYNHGESASLGIQKEATEQLKPPEKLPEKSGSLIKLGANQTQPEDYLESSEKLLQSLAEDEEKFDNQKQVSYQLLTPLNVGFMVLLLLLSATLPYIFSNPSVLSNLDLSQLISSIIPKISKTPQEIKPDQPQQTESVPNSPLQGGPNLASEEFVDLNLHTLSQVEATPGPQQKPFYTKDVPIPKVVESAPKVVTRPMPPKGSSLSSVLLPSVQPLQKVPLSSLPTSSGSLVPPGRRAQSGLLQPAISETLQNQAASLRTVVEESLPAPDPFYYVVINYDGKRSLQQARTIVPDAYVRKLSEGTRIQMGAFKFEHEAQGLLEKLQQQGISASIYRP
ncbi:MAG: SPOR domain-containing protein [Moorea sp. SIO4A3]|nr:SPOR domain-containing protein [Moorena sp. SIO4A3]